MRNLIKVLALGLAGVCSLVVLAGPAQAVLWGSKTNPLYGYENGAKFGKAYGNFVNEGGMYATSRSYQWDIQAGGNDVRVETDYYFYETSNRCDTPCWSPARSLQTDPTDVAAWIFDYRRHGLHGFATAARGGINICEIHDWANDPCSDHAWVSFSY